MVVSSLHDCVHFYGSPRKRLVTCWPYKPYLDYSPRYIVCADNCVSVSLAGTRPKYWSRFSGAQCQNGNNANFIIIILGVGPAKSGAGVLLRCCVSRTEYYGIHKK